MASQVGIDPVVLQEIVRLREALGSAYDRRTMDKFIKRAEVAAADSMGPAIRAALPVDTGRMKRSVKARSGRYRRPSGLIGPVQSPKKAFYARWVLREGARPHRIPKVDTKGKKLRTAIGLFNSVEHPGLRPNNVVTRVGERMLPRARQAFGATISKLINDEVFRGKVEGMAAKYAGKTRP